MTILQTYGVVYRKSKEAITIQQYACFSYHKMYIFYNRYACKSFACHKPQQEVDEDCDRKERAASAGVAAQEEDEVAEKAEQHYPHHVQPKEHVEGVKSTCNCAEVL